MSWNVNRGYRPHELSALISRVDPDIICLQEVDWGNARTNQGDVLEYLANKAGMEGVFGIEFYEIQTLYRQPKHAGGGVHGNAILSRLQFQQKYRIELPVVFNWETPKPSEIKIARLEKRVGARFALCAEVEVSGKKLLITSTYLEDKGGHEDGRVRAA